MPKEKLLISPGVKIGFLEVGDLVTNVKDHPLYYETPHSYLTHWRLYECVCICGKVRLYSESVLAQGEIKSCGCLKEAKRQAAYEEKEKALQRKNHKREITHQLAMAMDKLSIMLKAPLGVRNQVVIDETQARIRHLRAMKAYANRKPRT